MDKKFGLFIKTTEKNYFKNLIISFSLSLLLSFLIYIKIKSIAYTLLFFLIFLLHNYRINEYFLTQKTIYSGNLIFGRIDSDKEARFDALLYFILMLVVIFGVLILW